MATTKRSNQKDDQDVAAEPSALTDTGADTTTDTDAGPASGELGTGVTHDVPPAVDTSSSDTPYGHTSTVRLPFVTASFTRSSNGPGLPNPVDAIAGAGHVVGSVVSILPRNRALFYGGVAVLGVAGVVEWPVAALVATGTYVASRSRGRTRHEVRHEIHHDTHHDPTSTARTPSVTTPATEI